LTQLGVHENATNDDDHEYSYYQVIHITLAAMTPVALLFALHNLLVAFGTAGKSAGTPDVPTVLSLLLQKLVAPVALALESVYDRTRPTAAQVFGVTIVTAGVLLTASSAAHNDVTATAATTTTIHLPIFKVLCIALSTVPAAAGYLCVKRATQLPGIRHIVSDLELWTALCIPQTILSVMLALSVIVWTQQSHHANTSATAATLSMASVWTTLGRGLQCVALGQSPPTMTTTTMTVVSHDCAAAARWTWLALIPGLASNIAIPALVQVVGDATAVPLLQTIALPLSSIFAMTHWDAVVSSGYSTFTLLGLACAVTGLMVFYSAAGMRATRQPRPFADSSSTSSSLRFWGMFRSLPHHHQHRAEPVALSSASDEMESIL